MNESWEPPERSGGIDVDQSDVQAQDVIGRDKIELNLPPITRKGCYAQLSENIKFAIFFGVLMVLIYAFFEYSLLPTIRRPTPTPTLTETATPTPAVTPEPVTTPTEDGRRVQPTETEVPAVERTATVVDSGVGTPMAVTTATAAAGPSGIASSTPRRSEVTVTATLTVARSPTSTLRLPTPTPRWTPTPRPTPTSGPSPRPSTTATPRPPTPAPTPACPSTTVRLSPAAKLVAVGDRFSVGVHISCAADLAGYEVKFRFDPAVVVVGGASDAGFLASAGGSVFVAGPDVDNGAGQATIGATVLRPGPYPGGSGVLATFNLEAVGPGSTDLSLGVTLSNANAQSIPVGVTGGSVAVQPRATETPGN